MAKSDFFDTQILDEFEKRHFASGAWANMDKPFILRLVTFAAGCVMIFRGLSLFNFSSEHFFQWSLYSFFSGGLILGAYNAFNGIRKRGEDAYEAVGMFLQVIWLWPYLEYGLRAIGLYPALYLNPTQGLRETLLLEFFRSAWFMSLLVWFSNSDDAKAYLTPLTKADSNSAS